MKLLIKLALAFLSIFLIILIFFPPLLTVLYSIILGFITSVQDFKDGIVTGFNENLHNKEEKAAITRDIPNRINEVYKVDKREKYDFYDDKYSLLSDNPLFREIFEVGDEVFITKTYLSGNNTKFNVYREKNNEITLVLENNLSSLSPGFYTDSTGQFYIATSIQTKPSIYFFDGSKEEFYLLDKKSKDMEVCSPPIGLRKETRCYSITY
jgi:hypothetical protein